ncbi:MAG: 5'/3'-nucleotidase SurE, partial [Burkholderiales bacterium]
EGYLLGITSIAVSLTKRGGDNLATAAKVVADLVQRHKQQPVKESLLLNVNVPDVAYSELKGMRVTRLGKRHKAEPVVKSVNPRGDTIYWVGAAGPAQDAGHGTDFHAVENGFVSVTPLQMDLTQFTQIDTVNGWLNR